MNVVNNGVARRTMTSDVFYFTFSMTDGIIIIIIVHNNHNNNNSNNYSNYNKAAPPGKLFQIPPKVCGVRKPIIARIASPDSIIT